MVDLGVFVNFFVESLRSGVVELAFEVRVPGCELNVGFFRAKLGRMAGCVLEVPCMILPIFTLKITK